MPSLANRNGAVSTATSDPRAPCSSARACARVEVGFYSWASDGRVFFRGLRLLKRLGAMWRVEARALSQNAQPMALTAAAKVTRRRRRGRRTMGGNRREKKRGERVAIKRRTRDTTQQPGGRIDTHGRRLRRMLQDMNPTSPPGFSGVTGCLC